MQYMPREQYRLESLTPTVRQSGGYVMLPGTFCRHGLVSLVLLEGKVTTFFSPLSTDTSIETLYKNILLSVRASKVMLQSVPCRTCRWKSSLIKQAQFNQVLTVGQSYIVPLDFIHNLLGLELQVMHDQIYRPDLGLCSPDLVFAS